MTWAAGQYRSSSVGPKCNGTESEATSRCATTGIELTVAPWNIKKANGLRRAASLPGRTPFRTAPMLTNISLSEAARQGESHGNLFPV